jgi:hypothetical protein
MKEDKFLIGIVIGIVALVIVAIVAVMLRTPENEEYVADDDPAGVAHNYFLAIQRRDYEKAYSYVSDGIEAKPNLDKFIRDVDNFTEQSQSSLQIGETRITGDRAQVDISITTYRPGEFLESSSYTSQGTAYLAAGANGEGWKLTEFPYPFWGYDWNQPINNE